MLPSGPLGMRLCTGDEAERQQRFIRRLVCKWEEGQLRRSNITGFSDGSDTKGNREEGKAKELCQFLTSI